MSLSLRDAQAFFFSTDTTRGALLDQNGDGVPDGVRLRLVITGQPSSREWIELVHLCARLGLETTGLEFPVVVERRDVLDGALPVYFTPETGADGGTPEDGLYLRGAGDVRALWQAGLGQPDAARAARPALRLAPEANDDLSALFKVGGLYVDSDGDLMPDGAGVVIVIPERIPFDVGAALCDFGARIGLETTGLRFPLAVADMLDVGDASIVELDLRDGEAADATVSWEREVSGRRSLAVSGGQAGVAAALRGLAGAWPCFGAWHSESPTAADLTADLAAHLAAETETGRAAIVAAACATFHSAGRAGTLRLLTAESQVVAAAKSASRVVDGDVQLVIAPDDRLVLDDEWSAPWEVDRARAAFERGFTKLEPGRPAEALVLVSEPDEVRAALAAELGARLPSGSSVRVLSAYKAGLCWLREVVAPDWGNLGGLARIEVRYQRFTAPEHTTHLDMPIRWLQELFPGDELLARALGLAPDAIVFAEADSDQSEVYVATAFDCADRELARAGFTPRWYARPYLDEFPALGRVMASTGEIVLTQHGHVVYGEALPTDYDLFWDYYQHAVLPRVRDAIAAARNDRQGAPEQPFFEALDIHVWASEPEERLGIREEALSSSEALHEDLYFATLDYIAALGGQERATGTFGAGKSGGAYDAPGAIRPWLHGAPGQGPRAEVRLRTALRHLGDFCPTADASVREPLAPLPMGPRPRARIRAARWRAGTAGPVRIDVVVEDAGADALARLRYIEREATSLARRVPIAVELAGAAPVELDWPLAPVIAGRDVSQPARGPVPLDKIVWERDLGPWIAYLRGLPGVFARRAGRSYGGRSLDALAVLAPPGPGVWSRLKLSLWKPTALFIARHHANEVASTPAAFRLIELLATDAEYRPLLDRVNVVVLPFENPDGAALHEALCREHPYWKHHAARFNGVGLEFSREYFNPATRYGEARARPGLWRAWYPDLVTDNHGIPSHEWVQLFSGFNSPPRFGVSYWLVQAHLYGILRYVPDSPDHLAFAEALRDRVAREVAADDCLSAAAAPFRDRYDSWGARRVPEKFPADYVGDMFWFFQPLPPEAPQWAMQPPEYYRVTSANWVTEVADETARDEYLGGVAWGHVVANRAALRLLAEVAPRVERLVEWEADAPSLRLHRRRPLPAPCEGGVGGRV